MDHINVLLHFLSFASGIGFIVLSYFFYIKYKSTLIKFIITVDIFYTLLLLIDSLDIYLRKNLIEQGAALHSLIVSGQSIIAFVLLFYVATHSYQFIALISKMKYATKLTLRYCLGMVFLFLPLWLLTNIVDFLPLFMYKIPYMPLLYFALNGIGLIRLRKEVKTVSPTDERVAVFITLQTTYHITERENEIINSIIAGNSNQEISVQLFISVNTVKNHIYNIYRKIGIKNRYELISLVAALKK